MLLLLFLLLPHAAIAGVGRKCPDSNVCLLFHWCNSSSSVQLDDVPSTTQIEVTCNDNEDPSYIWIAVNPQTARRWNLKVFSSEPSLSGFTLFFGADSLQFNKDASVAVTVDGKKKGYYVESLELTPDSADEKLRARVALHEENMVWLDHLDGSNISVTSPNGNLEPTPRLQFWERLKDKTPCYTEEIEDACGRMFGDCDKLVPTTRVVPCNSSLWLNKGTTASEEWLALSSVTCIKAQWQATLLNSSSMEELKERELICASSLPEPCEPQEVKNLIDAGHDNFNITSRRVTCGAKFWLNSEGSLSNDWQLVSQMVCSSGSWQWKAQSDDRFRPIHKQKLACSFDEQSQFKAGFYLLTIGGTGLIVAAILIAVIVVCFCCRKGKKKGSGKSSSISRTEKGKRKDKGGTRECLGVKVKPKKNVDRTWTWSREAKQAQESSSNVSSCNIPESSGEEDKKGKGKKKSGKMKGKR